MDILVEEFTSVCPVSINPNEKVDVAYQLMREKDIRHLPVLEDESVMGIVSERDVLANHGKPWSEHLRVKDIMSTSVLTAYVKDGLGQVAYRLSKEKKGSAVILDLDDSLYGIFTTTDALNALVEIMLPEASEFSRPDKSN
jgi:acetoin utilization protein AcuB